jgi:hypothetical protein
MGIPIQIPADQLLFGVYPAGAGQYETVLRLETASASRARAVVNLFSMAQLFASSMDFSKSGALQSVAAAFFTNIPVQDDAALILRTGAMDAKDIALLFNTLSLYSK